LAYKRQNALCERFENIVAPWSHAFIIPRFSFGVGQFSALALSSELFDFIGAAGKD